MKWTFNRKTALGGRFAVRLHKNWRQIPTEVTRIRGAATQITYSSADPFGDSTATLNFPAITPLDDLDGPEFREWLGNYANVNIVWIPGIPWDDRYAGHNIPHINPFTGEYDVLTPLFNRKPDGSVTTQFNAIRVWEGFVASMEFTQDGTSSSLELQCQGALFQLDHYLQKPFYPPQPWPLETLIKEAFSHKYKPHLRTKPLIIQFPAGWKNKVPKYAGDSQNPYSPHARPGDLWSGYTTRNTGSWEHTLTGFIQDQLSVMITDDKSGVTPGNQWTVQQQRALDTASSGRQPVLWVRDRFRTADFSVWVGAPGVQIDMTGDSTQSENIIYGSGTDINGETWRNAVINTNGTRTDYLPLAASRKIYPPNHNPEFNRHAFASEAYTNFGSGFGQIEATTVAKQQLARDSQPGWSGTITLSVDPDTTMPRWSIFAGMTVKLKGFLGTGDKGFNFHIASVQANPMDGTVQLTVDSRYRDLLTVAEAQSRTRDPLDPVRMLQVNKDSVMIQDIQAPWDYRAGSGFIPKDSKEFYFQKPNSIIYPYTRWAKSHAPLHHGKFYVKCRADAHDSKRRWAGPIPILTAEKFTIARTEIYVSDINGNLIPCPFHVSLWDRRVTVHDMPRNNQGIVSPYIDNAFESVDPTTGQVWGPHGDGQFLKPVDGFIIGWGNRANGIYNRAGFSPGSEAEGDQATGMFFDDSTWDWDNTSNKDYRAYLKPGQKQFASAITIYAMFYAEWSEPVFFQGRLYRQNPGVQ